MDRARRAEPIANKYLARKEREKHLRRHKARLRHMKPDIDNKPPKKPKHLQRNLKKEQMMEDWYAKVEHENRILLAKMSEVMRRSTLDNVSKSHRFGKSLNRDRRKRDLQRITMENLRILRRIQNVQPVYDHWKWEEDRIRNEKYMENISEYGVPRHSVTRSGSSTRGHSRRRHGGESSDSLMMDLEPGAMDMLGSGGDYGSHGQSGPELHRGPGGMDRTWQDSGMVGIAGVGGGGGGGRSMPALPQLNEEYAHDSRGRMARALGEDESSALRGAEMSAADSRLPRTLEPLDSGVAAAGAGGGGGAPRPQSRGDATDGPAQPPFGGL